MPIGTAYDPETIENLARHAPPELVNVTPDALDAIAHLTNELARRANLIAVPGSSTWVPYRERSEVQRRTYRVTVMRLIQAMVMLGWIELPAPDVQLLATSPSAGRAPGD